MKMLLEEDIQVFKESLTEGIPLEIPEKLTYDYSINHAPKRKDILNQAEKRLALVNALRYFPKEQHAFLAKEFWSELMEYGRIYMHRYRPNIELYARPIDHYPAKSKEAAAIMLMIHNNLDHSVAQHPHELITYGG